MLSAISLTSAGTRAAVRPALEALIGNDEPPHRSTEAPDTLRIERATLPVAVWYDFRIR